MNASTGPLAALRAGVGQTLGPTAWREVTQDMVDTFAGLSGDRQWIHVDVARAAAESPFKTTVVHGTLTLAMIDGFRDELVGFDGVAFGLNLGYDRVRFPAPVRTGARVRATAELIEATDRGGGWLQTVQRFTVEVEGEDRPACVADSVVRVFVE